MQARIARSLAGVDAAAWNALPGAEAPFLRHEFLLALEQSGCATAQTGWDARHALLYDGTGRLAAAMPLYLKSHSWGEFVFDFAWADAYHRAGLAYYPRLVSAVPFTPATGPRLLAAGAHRGRLLAAARACLEAEAVSSLHVLFPAADDRDWLGQAGLMPRLDCQFHWQNEGYATFDDFLAGFTAEKRKKLRRERRRVAESGMNCRTVGGRELDAPLLDAIHHLHAITFARHGHAPYLNREFFGRIAETMPEALVVELAEMGGAPVACSISLRGRDTLYGRYWGASGDFHSLHFETLLLPGHRVLHPGRTGTIRARHAGRAQAPARLPADAGLVPARGRGSALCGRDRLVARPRAGAATGVAATGRAAPALPAGRHPG